MEHEKLELIIKKLPTYCDTGEPFVPQVDPCFVIDRDSGWNWGIYELRQLQVRLVNNEWMVSGSEGDIKDFYSTREAANEKAKMLSKT